MRLINKMIVTIMLTATIGCSEDFLNINTDPNNPQAAPAFLLLPSAQASMAGNITAEAEFITGVLSRHYGDVTNATYAYNSSSFQGPWDGLYTGALKDIEAIIAQGTEEEEWGYVGVAKTMKAFIYHHLVDYYGDIPYSGAARGEVTINPAYDNSEDVYADLLVLLDSAVSDLNKESGSILNDLIYAGDKDLWIKAANTIKLKMLLNLSLVDEAKATTGINTLITEDLLITEMDEDFQFAWGTSLAPENRNPYYPTEYDGSATAVYIDNYFMYNMLEKNDPRIRYYLYRQGEYSDLNFDTTPCSGRTDCQYWPLLMPLGEDYIGRDHGDPSGVPGDGGLRTTFGVYPVGGSFDNDSFSARSFTTAGREGAGGAGITPYFTSSITYFMLAEAKVRLPGITAGETAETYLEMALSHSFEKVRDFALSTPEATNIAEWEEENSYDYAAEVDNYIQGIVTDFNNAASPLEVVMTEKYFATWGMSMETYTDIRRTGYPADLPQSLKPSGPSPLRWLYPVTEVSINPNVPEQPPITTPVFWDVN